MTSIIKLSTRQLAEKVRHFFVKKKVIAPICQNTGLHNWKHIGVSRHFWDIQPDGRITGMYSSIDRLLSMYGQLETVREQYTKLTSWKDQGFNVVNTSWDHYECTECGKRAMEEFYTNPHHHNMSPAELQAEKDAINAVIKLVS